MRHASPCTVADLTDDVLECILSKLTADFMHWPNCDRYSAARTCKAWWNVHLVLSLPHITIRSGALHPDARAAEGVHWSHDVRRIQTILHRLRNVSKLRLFLDAPCLRARGANAVPLPDVCFPSVRWLFVESGRAVCGAPSAHALARLIQCFPNLAFLRMRSIRNVGCMTLRAVLADRSTELRPGSVAANYLLQSLFLGSVQCRA